MDLFQLGGCEQSLTFIGLDLVVYFTLFEQPENALGAGFLEPGGSQYCTATDERSESRNRSSLNRSGGATAILLPGMQCKWQQGHGMSITPAVRKSNRRTRPCSGFITGFTVEILTPIAWPGVRLLRIFRQWPLWT